MKYATLRNIIANEAHSLRESAGWQGSWSDGGCGSLLDRLDNFQKSLIFEHDLRPSEFYMLDTIEVGEPSEFSQEIKKYKESLAQSIKLP